MDKLTKEAFGSKKNISPEGLNKRKDINGKILKFGCLPILLLFIFGVIVSVFSDEKDKSEITKEKTVIQEDKNTISEIENNDEKTIEQLKREIESINKGIDFSIYREEVQSIQMEIVLFGSWAKTIIEAKDNQNKEVKLLAKELEEKVKLIQVKEFPLLRKAYKEAIYKKLWLEDIETKILGKKNKTIQFTGSLFASNKNKQETQTTLSEVLKQFRFNRVNYKWYEYDDKFTYYEMDVSEDNELVFFN